MLFRKRPTPRKHLLEDLVTPLHARYKGNGFVYLGMAISPIRRVPYFDCFEFRQEAFNIVFESHPHLLIQSAILPPEAAAIHLQQFAITREGDTADWSARCRYFGNLSIPRLGFG